MGIMVRHGVMVRHGTSWYVMVHHGTSITDDFTTGICRAVPGHRQGFSNDLILKVWRSTVRLNTLQ